MGVPVRPAVPVTSMLSGGRRRWLARFWGLPASRSTATYCYTAPEPPGCANRHCPPVRLMLAVGGQGGSWGHRGQQGGRVVAAAVQDAVDEQGGGTQHLARGQAAVDIAADPVGYRGAGPVCVEGRDVQAELGGVPAQVAVFERLLPVEQQLVHVPEPALQRGGLRRGRRGEGVRMDAGQREVPECEPHVPAQLAFDLLDRVERLPRVRALVVAVLEDQRAGGRTAGVIDFLIQRRQ